MAITSEAAEEILSRRRARQSFAGFVHRFGWEPPPARHHRLLIERLDAVARGELRRLMVFMPPGGAKSYYGSVLFPAYFMGVRERCSVIQAAHTAELAEKFGRKARDITGLAQYRATYGKGLTGASKAAGRWDLDDGSEYFAAGVGGSITGRRGDLAVIDDPVKSAADAESAVKRETAWDWYLRDLRTRLKPGAAIVLIMTRWHWDDLAGRILPEDYDFTTGQVRARDGEVWDVLSIPALSVAGEEDPLGRRLPDESYWPEWFDAETLKAERQAQGPRGWASLYQQRPTPDEGDYFRAEWIRWYEQTPKHLRVYAASDYAVTDSGGDWTVHVVVGVDPQGDIYLLDLWRRQATTDVWIDALITLAQDYEPEQWGEESGQILKSLDPFIRRMLRERRVSLYRKQYPSLSSKEARAQAIRGFMAQGRVYFPKGKGWVDPLVSELLQFPAGLHDDQVDALAIIGRMLSEMAKAEVPTPKRRPPAPGTFEWLLQAEEKPRSRYRRR